mmetsp:Transcript_12597/g.22981  ORF Transcript_12597/g.22981 Transcript_12597/m.22981 type:complete len:271 (-) Transcript_12597:43-855(-)
MPSLPRPISLSSFSASTSFSSCVILYIKSVASASFSATWWVYSFSMLLSLCVTSWSSFVLSSLNSENVFRVVFSQPSAFSLLSFSPSTAFNNLTLTSSSLSPFLLISSLSISKFLLTICVRFFSPSMTSSVLTNHDSLSSFPFRISCSSLDIVSFCLDIITLFSSITSSLLFETSDHLEPESISTRTSSLLISVRSLFLSRLDVFLSDSNFIFSVRIRITSSSKAFTLDSYISLYFLSRSTSFPISSNSLICSFSFSAKILFSFSSSKST